MAVARRPTLVQLDDELIQALDRRARSEGRSRSAVIRAAVEAYVEDERKRVIDEAIIEGYRRFPPDDEFDAWAEESAKRSIADEPW
jgi:metal-responsive CopG/Arc/MetJ family transcriptional regulator